MCCLCLPYSMSVLVRKATTRRVHDFEVMRVLKLNLGSFFFHHHSFFLLNRPQTWRRTTRSCLILSFRMRIWLFCKRSNNFVQNYDWPKIYQHWWACHFWCKCFGPRRLELLLYYFCFFQCADFPDRIRLLILSCLMNLLPIKHWQNFRND